MAVCERAMDADVLERGFEISSRANRVPFATRSDPLLVPVGWGRALGVAGSAAAGIQLHMRFADILGFILSQLMTVLK